MPGITTDLLLDGFRKMLLIRHAEQAIAADFKKNKIFSFLHLSIGQEAVAAGTCLALDLTDRVFGNHRSHGHYLGKGGDLYSMFAEIYGKEDGCCRGKGGSMHMLDRTVNFMGSAPILGSIVPIAVGSAFQQKVQAPGAAITAVFFGDGASEEGVVYESMNLAATLELPILFVLENNLYAVNSPESARRSFRFDRKMMTIGLGVQYLSVNGNSFTDMYQVAAMARSFMRKESKPVLIEAKTFRDMAHSGPITDESVRVVDTKDIRDSADPIKSIMPQLRSRGVSADTLDSITAEVLAEVEAAMISAKAAKEPDFDDVMEDVYAS